MKGNRVRTDPPLEQYFRGILLERIGQVQELIRKQEDKDEMVHEVRRTVKRIRAVLKLIRDEIGYSSYYRENLYFRDLGRVFSGARDSRVLGQVFRSLCDRHPGQVPAGEQQAVLESLDRKHEKELSRILREKGGFDQITGELDLALGRTEQYCRMRNEFGSPGKGIRRIYGRARRGLHHLKREFQMAAFHEYRKNTKYLLHQVEVLSPLYPRVLKSYARSIDRHAETLGVARDYDRLGIFIGKETGDLIGNDTRSGLLEQLGLLRKELLEKIFSDAMRIYAEKPGAFVRRLQAYWDAGDGLQFK